MCEIQGAFEPGQENEWVNDLLAAGALVLEVCAQKPCCRKRGVSSVGYNNISSRVLEYLEKASSWWQMLSSRCVPT